MRKAFDAVVAGHICLDIIPAIKSTGFVFSPGSLLEIGPAILSTGGPVSNTGLALHKLGITTRLIGKVGADPFGQSIRRIITDFDPGLGHGMVQDPGETSSYTVILSPPDADRMFLHCPGCNSTFGAGDIDFAMVSEARLFHFGYPPLLRRVIANDGEELVEILQRVKSVGVTTSLDLCMPDPQGYSGSVDWPRILTAALPYVDIFLPSIKEMLLMLYPGRSRATIGSESEAPGEIALETLRSIGSDLIALGPAVVGLKLGERGLYLKTANDRAWEKTGRARPERIASWLNRELWSSCFQVEVVGATGAGDATIAGFLAALLRGCTPEESVTMACAVGACNVEAADALGGLLDWETTSARIAGGWHRRGPGTEMPGWCESTVGGVWRGPADHPA
jgi:sugar/nucleoside kinase (ribokinase family)